MAVCARETNDSYTSLSKLYTSALELVRWVLLCRCEGEGGVVELSDSQRNDFTKFVEKGETLFIDLNCKDEWADFNGKFVTVLTTHRAIFSS